MQSVYGYTHSWRSECDLCRCTGPQCGVSVVILTGGDQGGLPVSVLVHSIELAVITVGDEDVRSTGL